jgi:hypothetical protein
MTTYLKIISLFMFGLICNTSLASALTPKDTVNNFYKTYQKTTASGLPSPQEMRLLSPYLSKKLTATIENARAYQADYVIKNPDNKPPFIEGDLFSSLFEGFTNFKLIRHKTIQKIHIITIQFVYIDASKQATKWTDEAIVLKENGRYVIDDIRLLGAGEFNHAGNLQEILLAR